MTNVATVETNEVMVYGRIELKADLIAENVQELMVVDGAEYTLYNTSTPFNMFHEDDTHIAFNSVTIIVNGQEKVLPIGAYNIEVDYIEEENKFIATFSTNTNIDLEVLNNSEIKPLEMMVSGWDYSTGGTEEFIDVSVKTSLIVAEFVNPDEY